MATAQALTLTNPIVSVTQPPIWHEINGSVSNSFLSVVTIFGNQQADTAHAARGGAETIFSIGIAVTAEASGKR